LGIRVPAHVTGEARACLEHADEVLHLVTEPLAIGWIESVNSHARSLYGFYEPGKRRTDIYASIVEEILSTVRRARDVCVAFYGHPGVFVDASRKAIRQARREGFPARMLPGISAEDCLFADLDIDPCKSGWQSYEATDLLTHRRRIDPSAALIVWQPSIVATPTFVSRGDLSKLPMLVEYLEEFYPADQDVVCYEASPSPLFGPRVEHVSLSTLGGASISPATTLFIRGGGRKATSLQ
jgi:hypothetical protein